MTEPRRRRSAVRSRSLAAMAAIALAVPILAPATAIATGQGFLPYQAISLGSEPDAVTIGDVTGDARSDIVLTSGDFGDASTDFHLVVIAQASDGTLLAPVFYATAGSYSQRPTSVAIGDTNGDGRTDVVVGLDRYGIQWFPGQADGTLGAPTFVASPDSTRIRIGVFDKGGRDQVVGIGWGTDTITEFADTGAGLVAVGSLAVQHDGYDDLEVGDVTGDGRTDWVVMSGQGLVPNISVLPQLVGGGFGAPAEYSIGGNALTHGIGLGDVTGDGRLDVVASYGGNQPASHIAVFAQTAGGLLGSPSTYASYDIPEPVEVADFDRDGRLDAATVHGGWLRAGVYRQRSDGTLAPEELFSVPGGSSFNAHSMAVGDVNGDGWTDIVESDTNAGVVILRNQGAWPPIVTTPGAPTLTSATASDGRVTLAWAAPASDGGSPITSYTAVASPGGTTCVTGTLGCTITGLTNGISYSFTVRAANSAGSGPPSNALAATPGVAPSAPSSLQASPNEIAGVVLTWQPPSSPGSPPVSSYRIYRGTPTQAPSLYATTGASPNYTDFGVVNGATYVYQASAVNAFAEGPRSAPLTTQRGTPPSAPLGLAGSVTGQGISIHWSSPASTGGSPVTSYRIYRGTASGTGTVILVASPGITSYLDKSVARKTRYFYRVTAVNNLGESSPSNEVSLTSK